jgi:hypothetical protein
MATTPNYDINYDDERFQQVEAEEAGALAELDNSIGGMISNSDQFFQDQIDATNAWANTQSQLQQEQTDFTIEQIEQQKEQANKDYLKEQSGAYVDWQKQSNPYGANAEKMASAGLTNTGYSESSQVSMYNTYQNRVATAREVFNQAVLNYNNAITEARLQNNSILAEIALTALEKSSELALQGFQYKNQLILDLSDRKMQTKQFYANQWQNVLNQMNTENALKEEARQFESNQAWQTEQNEINRAWEAEQAQLDRDFQTQRDALNREFEAAQAELNRKHDKEMLEAKTKAEKELLEQQHKNDLAKLKKQQEYELAQLDKQLANQKALAKYNYDLSQKSTTFGSKSTGGSGGSAASTFKNTKTSTQKAVSNKVNTTLSNNSKTMQSILALGYGPISSEKLAGLVNSGLVEEYTKDGVTLFRKTNAGKNVGQKLSAINKMKLY